MTSEPRPAAAMTEEQIAGRIHELIDELSTRGTHEAFAQVLEVLSYAGMRVGDAARSLATSHSWAEVGQLSGTSKQAAWERWRGQHP